MATITLRSIKGAPLTITEVDDNFNNLNIELGDKLNTASYTAQDVLDKIKTKDGVGSGLDADYLQGYSFAEAATINTLALRNSTGALTVTDINLSGTGAVNFSTYTALKTAATSGTYTITLPALTGTVITNADSGTVTNAMLAGSISNAKLSNSSITIDGNSVSLGGSISLAGGNNTWTGTQTFRDNKFVITDDTDTSKVLNLQLSGITTGTTRTLTIPDASGTVALSDSNIRFNSVGIGQAASGTAGELKATGIQVTSLGVGTAYSGVTGEIRATNNITAYYSDDRLKTKLGSIENALDKVDQLSGFYYEANETAQALGYEVKREVGVSAQEVQAIMPEIVAEAPIDAQYLTVRYERLAPLLIEAIKELRQEINKIKEAI